MSNDNIKPLIFWVIDEIDVDEVLTAYFKENERVNLVIIGANNGKTKDFLLDYLTWKGVRAVLVEPVADLFLQLKESLGVSDQLYFENAAIYERACRRTMYRLNTCDQFPDWAVGLGSFKKTTVLDHGNQLKGIRRHMTKEVVDCITLKSLLDKYKFDFINILQIDTEGYDYEIVKTIDFKKIRPDIIIVEFFHLSFYQYYSMLNLLLDNNYQIYKNQVSFDIMAVDRKFL